jgi:membrane-bound lytic murein transglycosylase D
MLQQRFQGEYVIDLASLRNVARLALPLLEGLDETKQYATWLRTRLDYLEVAEEMRLIIPPPKAEPGQPPKPAPNPAPELQRKAWQKQMAKRPMPRGAEALVPRLKPIFVEERIPAELVWLAEVESSFDPRARSPVGAAGLFQLMPATAKERGLALRPDDERLHPDKNARAAAKYLRYLHGRFNDWPLALAAYNAGEGRLQGLLQKTKARTFDQIARRLSAETQMYVPKFEATLRRREGIALAQLKAPAR